MPIRMFERRFHETGAWLTESTIVFPSLTTYPIPHVISAPLPAIPAAMHYFNAHETRRTPYNDKTNARSLIRFDKKSRSSFHWRQIEKEIWLHWIGKRRSREITVNARCPRRRR